MPPSAYLIVIPKTLPNSQSGFGRRIGANWDVAKWHHWVTKGSWDHGDLGDGAVGSGGAGWKPAFPGVG